ncbi:MAG: sodium:calcium antiporter [Methylocystis sp.]|uniref:sodium:calcium antiporter n=1 Tax=Methylocystis sp. TaxID=1911079 RepID=UPI003D0EE31C
MTVIAEAWTKFAICVALIGVAGPALSYHGDIIARRTGLTRSWVGLLLLATATSLPELLTGVTAVTAVGAPNIAIGDALGSCIFNLAILVFLDALSREGSVFTRMDQGHILTAGFGVILIGFAGASLLLGVNQFWPKFFHIGIYTPVLIALYLLAMRATFGYESRRSAAGADSAPKPDIGLARAIGGYLLAAGIVAAAGVWLPFVGLEISEAMSWRTTFVGTLFVAAATSIPEFVVSMAAMRLGALDMGIANLLGSNLFNMLVLAVDDIAYEPGSLFAAASPTHAVTAFAAVIMSGILIVALIDRPSVRFFGVVGWTSLSLSIVYFLSTYLAYLHGH